MNKKLMTLLIASACCSVGAQAIYRCGDSYGHTPCPNATVLQAGKREFTAADGQRAAKESREATERNAKLADRMERDRLKAESQPAALTFLPVRKSPSDVRFNEKKVAMAKPDKRPVFMAHAPAKPGEKKPKPQKKKKSD